MSESALPPPTPPESFAGPGPQPIGLETTKPPKRKKWPLVVGGIGLFLAGVAVGAAGNNNDESDAVATKDATSGSTEAAVAAIDTTTAPTTTRTPDTTRPPTTTAAPTTTSAPTTTAAPTTTVAPTTTAAPTTTVAPTTTAAPTRTAAPTTTVAPAPPKPSLTPSQQNAIRTAQQYLDYTGFSRLGLIDQLEYEQYSTADATFAVDSLNVDWNAQAGKVAQAYLDYTGFSCQGLIDQLEYEQFTADQATFGARQVGLC